MGILHSLTAEILYLIIVKIENSLLGQAFFDTFGRTAIQTSDQTALTNQKGTQQSRCDQMRGSQFCKGHVSLIVDSTDTWTLDMGHLQ